MKKLFDKNFCVWLVPAQDGKVRKLRFGVFSLIACAGLGLIISGFFLFVISDYARVQLLRYKNYFNMQRLNYERDQLISAKGSLEGQVQTLKSNNEKAQTYEQNLKQRVDELGAIIGSAVKMGVVSEIDSLQAATVEKQGVGGAEIACLSNGQDNCLNTNPVDDKIFDGELLSLNTEEALSEKNLLEQMDRYIEIVRMLPIGVPANGHISSNFGYRHSPFHAGFSMHEGIDFSLSQGSYIFSTGEGVVKDVKRCATYGLMVDIAHNDKIVTRYAHLSKTFVKEGEKICRGEVLGLAGSTGRSTGPHLHYEVLIADRPQNPLNFINLASRLNKIFG